MFEAVLPCPFVLGSELLYIPPLWDPWRSLAAGPWYQLPQEVCTVVARSLNNLLQRTILQLIEHEETCLNL